MSNIDLEKAYNSTGENIQVFFSRTEQGFCVPLYQRGYTWEEENIDQLFEDIVLGIRELSDEGGGNSTTFLGTVILTDNETVEPWDNMAKPTGVQLVIDGQQRISTIALLSIQIIERLHSLSGNLVKEEPYTVLQNRCNDLIEDLTSLHTINLKRGSTPPEKPKIISAREDDRWTFAGNDESYKSPVAHYIAKYIRVKDTQQAYKSVNKDTGARVRRNIDSINWWLEAICDAHIPDTHLYGQFPVGEKIVTDRIQEYVFGFKAGNLEAVSKAETDKQKADYFAAAIYHLFLFSYYLLRRCGVNRLEPIQEEWGFDMFQALNATGTPLTAMETFLPTVIQAEQATGHDWIQTPSSEYIADIEKLFETAGSNEQKNSRTNDLLGTFALCYDGEKLGNKFSAQKRWMTNIFEKNLQLIGEKREFLNYLAQVANFFRVAWYMEDGLKGLENHDEGELAWFLVQYLKDANSRLSAPILARFYSQGIEKESMDDFVEAVKACAAFFTLWRSARTTSGLADIYRKFFMGTEAPVKVDKHSWTSHPESISSKKIKQYFFDILKHYKIHKKDVWLDESEHMLLYNTAPQTVCRFVLFVAGHNRVPDDSQLGLTTQGRPGTCPILDLESWKSPACKSIEHVAPQNPREENDWQINENKVNKMGNLILLPKDINQYVTNKGWAAKFIHYSHLGVRESERVEELKNEADKRSITLSESAKKTLSDVEYNCTIEPIIKIGIEGSWDDDLIDKRTNQIKEIAWDTLMPWLET